MDSFGVGSSPGISGLGLAAPSQVEVWHRRLMLFSVTATLALLVEVAYAQLVPKMPKLYAVLLRSAVWDCIVVGVLAAQVIDLSTLPILAGTDGGHYLPVAVLIYHSMTLLVCTGYDLCSRHAASRGRFWHRSLVSRRVLQELAGGTGGRRMVLGRICFLVSGAAMWGALRMLLWFGDGMPVLAGFIVLLFMSYCAAGFAALEPRNTLPGQIVQWLCTGWGSREAILQGPLKILGGIFMLPFAASVILAQIWLRTIAFLIWLGVACPCCRLQRADNVYDAFEREMAVPLLQCSFLAFACTLAATILGAAHITGTSRTAVAMAGLYYTGMLLAWAAPSVLQAKVAAEEAHDAAAALGDDADGTQPLRGEHPGGESDVELEDIRSTCEELRALLYRERHDHSIELAQVQGKLRDQELRTRAAEREMQDVKREHVLVKQRASDLDCEVDEWRKRCSELCSQVTGRRAPPTLPRLRWSQDGPGPGRPVAEAGCDGHEGRNSADIETGEPSTDGDSSGSEALQPSTGLEAPVRGAESGSPTLLQSPPPPPPPPQVHCTASTPAALMQTPATPEAEEDVGHGPEATGPIVEDTSPASIDGSHGEPPRNHSVAAAETTVPPEVPEEAPEAEAPPLCAGEDGVANPELMAASEETTPDRADTATADFDEPPDDAAHLLAPSTPESPSSPAQPQSRLPERDSSHRGTMASEEEDGL